MLTRGPQWALLLIAFCAATTLVAQQAAEIKGLLRQATDREVTDLEVAAGKSRTAQFALDKYDAFLAAHSLTSKQQEIVQGRLKVWHKRVNDGLCRVGNTWVPLEEARKIGHAADVLIEEAYIKIKEGEFKRAKDLLERAARADPSGTRADYLLGMLNSPNHWNYAPTAEKHFEHAQRRDPENPALLNNLALSKVKMGRYSEAIDLWASALRSGNEVPEIVHNLARFARETGEKRIAATDSHRQRAKKLYEKAVDEKKGPPSEPTVGWLYSKLTLPADERERSELSTASEAQAAGDAKPRVVLIEVGSGTGFVIHPGYVLTNRHVAQAGTSYLIADPILPETTHVATVQAVCKDFDLAVLRCESLRAPPVVLNSQPIGRGTDVMILGFPRSDLLGRTLKSLRGSIFGYLDDQNRDTVLYEAPTNPGNSGGPVCDATGNVIAVHFVGIELRDRLAGKFGGGIPVEKGVPFLQQSLPEITFVAGSGKKLDWPEVDRLVSQSTVFIRLFDRSLPFVEKPPTQKGTNVFEDRTCVVCKGRMKVPCPVKGCYRGSVSDFEQSFMVVDQGYGQSAVRFQKPKLASCSGCRGAGMVDCPHCRDGTDPRLR